MLLAARCAVCDRPGASPCPACHAELRPASPEPDPPGLAGLVAVLRYDGAARDLVARLKYRNRRLALGWLAGALATRVIEAGLTVDVVAWAPTTDAHRRARGFDHGEEVARAVARRLGVPARGLLRRGPGPPQTGRQAHERRADGPRFSVRRAVAPTTRVLVVDDVVTTGATLRAAVAALRSSGLTVVPAALARTPLRSALRPEAETIRGMGVYDRSSAPR